MKASRNGLKWAVAVLMIAVLTLSGHASLAEGEPPELGFEVVDSPEPLEVETYNLHEFLRWKRLAVFDVECYDMFFDYDSVTPDQLRETVEKNKGIGEPFKPLFYWYIDAVTTRYPEADLRPFYFNLQTLEVVECTPFELAFNALSIDSLGVYRRDQNKIYVDKRYDYPYGTFNFQIMIHEITHVARCVFRKDYEGWDRYEIKPGYTYYEIAEESLNSLFAVSLFDYEERDIAYQMSSNMFLVMIECLDGKYVMSDYLNHSLTYFAHILDEHNGHNNYAMTIFQLIEAQRADYQDDKYARDENVYYPVYDYLCRMYLDRYAPEDCDEATLTALVDVLIEKTFYDVPEEYPIDTDHFYEFAREYMM